ncbi:MAG: hypothetical protein HOP36_13355 [Methyloglobulus sp.]|nr:hypothetical protein [Methyloglobulus sp.]
MKIPKPDDRKTLLEVVKVGDYTIKVYWDADDVLLQANGFTMLFPEKPNALAHIIKKDSRPAVTLLDNDAALHELDEIGERWRRAVHDRIRKDWGKECFVADGQGNWHHPLFEDSASQFSCIHCDKHFSGATLAENLWHCPSPDCDGSPMDIHGIAS